MGLFNTNAKHHKLHSNNKKNNLSILLFGYLIKLWNNLQPRKILEISLKHSAIPL